MAIVLEVILLSLNIFMNKTSFWMIKTTSMILMLACFSTLCAPVKGDMFTPSAPCSAPYNGLKASQWEIDSFKSCIENFVNEMNSAASTHRNAANNAIDQWNRFARGGY